jgi:hypothetical protein
VRIASRFCGPPSSANGGYTAGSVAAALGGTVEVTLRSPPRLEHELALQVSAESARLDDAELLVAEARRATLDVAPPRAVTFEAAQEAAQRYVGFERHHFPGCFVCGPARAPGDGLRIFPGTTLEGDQVVAPWVPDASLADAGGRVRDEFRWAALDCAGYFAIAAPDYPVALLGRMTATLFGELSVGERCVVHGAPLLRDGRKLQAVTALYGSDGALRGLARQVWISV